MQESLPSLFGPARAPWLILLALIVAHRRRPIRLRFERRHFLQQPTSEKAVRACRMLLASAAGAFALGGTKRPLPAMECDRASQIGSSTGGGYTAKGVRAVPRRDRVRLNAGATRSGQLNMNSAPGTPDGQTLKSAHSSSAQFPAQYVARARKARCGQIRSDGRLTLKVTARFAVQSISVGTARVSAGTTINRLDFGAGRNPWLASVDGI
jgi:hypothetical protein